MGFPTARAFAALFIFMSMVMMSWPLSSSFSSFMMPLGTPVDALPQTIVQYTYSDRHCRHEMYHTRLEEKQCLNYAQGNTGNMQCDKRHNRMILTYYPFSDYCSGFSYSKHEPLNKCLKAKGKNYYYKEACHNAYPQNSTYTHDHESQSGDDDHNSDTWAPTSTPIPENSPTTSAPTTAAPPSTTTTTSTKQGGMLIGE